VGGGGYGCAGGGKRDRAARCKMMAVLLMAAWCQIVSIAALWVVGAWAGIPGAALGGSRV
jgi:hypothetical protein